LDIFRTRGNLFAEGGDVRKNSHLNIEAKRYIHTLFINITNIVIYICWSLLRKKILTTPPSTSEKSFGAPVDNFFEDQTTIYPQAPAINVYHLLHLVKFPGFASFQAELLEPPKEHDNDEYEFAGVAPPPGKARPSVCTESIWIDLPAAAVSHREADVSISTACRT
jgi:hypothetical protein